MKNLKLTCFSLCLTLLMLTSCSENPSKKLINTWSVTNIETTTPLADSLKAQLLSGSEMAFTSDGHYKVVGGIGVDEGTYTVDKEAKNLSTISAAGQSNSSYTIQTLTDDNLVLNNNGNTVSLTAKK